MARLFTSGAEVQFVGPGFSAALSEGPGFTGSGTISINTSTPNSGLACFSVAANSASFNDLNFAQTYALSTDYYFRGYFNISSLPTTNDFLLCELNTAGSVTGVSIHTDGTCQVQDAGGTVHTSAVTIAANTWFLVEMHVKIVSTTTGTIEGRVNGQTVWSAIGNANTGASTAANFYWGKVASANPAITTVLFDDLAVNDGSGTSQNSWCGPGKVVLLKPLSDSSRTGWTAGAAGTTNLQDAVKNTPPPGWLMRARQSPVRYAARQQIRPTPTRPTSRPMRHRLLLVAAAWA